MKKMVGFLLFICLGFTTGNAQTPHSSLLWEIKGNGLEKPSYIFGSFHIMCKSDFQISTILSNKLAETKQFYGELKMDDPDMQQKMAMKMMLHENTLTNLLGKAAFPKLNDQFQKIVGMPLSMFDNYKPFLPLSLLVINSIACPDKIQPETEFVNIAKQKNIPIYGLETIDDEIKAIDREPLDSQINALQQVILHYDSVKNVMQEMTALYQLRDIDTLYSFMKTTDTGGDFEVAMLVERNRNWIPVIKKAMNEMASFFVVGAGHLGGQEGIINLLRKQGYLLTPIKY
jgi:uncharacterized protein